eukprot:SAG31_NODE_122_length_23797_cov_39.343812_21_plen_155_part_00
MLLLIRSAPATRAMMAAHLPLRVTLRRSAAAAQPVRRVSSLSREVSTGVVGDSARTAIEAVHAATGLPWWGTLVVCGATMRLGLAPLSLLQRTHVQRLARLLPMLRQVWSPAADDPHANDAAKTRARGTEWTEMKEILARGSCSPAAIIGVPGD